MSSMPAETWAITSLGCLKMLWSSTTKHLKMLWPSTENLNSTTFYFGYITLDTIGTNFLRDVGTCMGVKEANPTRAPSLSAAPIETGIIFSSFVVYLKKSCTATLQSLWLPWQLHRAVHELALWKDLQDRKFPLPHTVGKAGRCL